MGMTIDDAESVLTGLRFPEAPRWHAGRVWLSDQHAHRVLAFDDEWQARTIVELDDMPSGLGFLPDSTLLIASVRTRSIVRFDRGALRTHADLSVLRTGWVNDMLVDAQGRAYVGFNRGRYAGEAEPAPDALVLVRPDGTFEVVADDVQRPNGCAISPDGSTMILAQSRAKCLTAYDIAPDGRLERPRLFAQLDETKPDGICLDAQGAVWVASPAARAFVRVEEGGRVTHRIDANDRWAIACVLGGAQRQTLFMLTARTSVENLRELVDADADARSGSIGWVDAIDVPVPGAGWP
jgi:sugar lactone lactonase YvrE